MAGCDLTFDPAPAKIADPVPFYVVQAQTIDDSWVDGNTYDDAQQAFDDLDDLRSRGLDGYRVVRRWRQP